VNTIINRPASARMTGDIQVPVGTVSVIGTTACPCGKPGRSDIVPDEVSQMLDDGEAIIPASGRRARAGLGGHPASVRSR
jgi:GTP cyclohydrolase FolE2